MKTTFRDGKHKVSCFEANEAIHIDPETYPDRPAYMRPHANMTDSNLITDFKQPYSSKIKVFEPSRGARR